MATVNEHPMDASQMKTGNGVLGSTEVARSAGSAKGEDRDLDWITKNNQLDAEYGLPVTADAQGTWVCSWALDGTSACYCRTRT